MKSLESLRLYIRESVHVRKHVRDSTRQAASILGTVPDVCGNKAPF